MYRISHKGWGAANGTDEVGCWGGPGILFF